MDTTKRGVRGCKEAQRQGKFTNFSIILDKTLRDSRIFYIRSITPTM